MKALIYRTRMANGEMRSKTAYSTGVPGLYVSSPEADDPHRDPSAFMVVHPRSGSVVAYDFASPEAALACAQKLACLTDWTADATTLRSEVDSDLVFAIADENGGIARGRMASDFIDNGVIA